MNCEVNRFTVYIKIKSERFIKWSVVWILVDIICYIYIVLFSVQHPPECCGGSHIAKHTPVYLWRGEQ